MLLCDRTVPNFMHYAQEAKFCCHKSLTCPEYAQLNLVYCSVRETCAERFLLHYSVAFFSPYISRRKKTKNIFSVKSVPVCRSRPTKICISVCQLYPKLRIMVKKGRFHHTLVQLVQTVHRSASCAIGHVLLHSSALCP